MLAHETSTFTAIPAIDLRGGRVVRLRQGDFAREQVYANDPVAVAVAFATLGAAWIHVVDLDGARSGERRQTAAIAAVGSALHRAGRSVARLQVGGGLRTADAVATTLARGADRVVIGTAALRDPAFVSTVIARHGAERIAVALDVRDGLAVGEGWVEGAAGVPVGEALARLHAAGVTTFIVTAIERDGLLGGPDVGLLAAVVAATDADVVASGGIASLDDLRAVRRIGCSGVIVGRALYDGTLNLAAAISASGRPADPSTSR